MSIVWCSGACTINLAGRPPSPAGNLLQIRSPRPTITALSRCLVSYKQSTWRCGSLQLGLAKGKPSDEDDTTSLPKDDLAQSLIETKQSRVWTAEIATDPMPITWAAAPCPLPVRALLHVCMNASLDSAFEKTGPKFTRRVNCCGHGFYHSTPRRSPVVWQSPAAGRLAPLISSAC